MKHPIMRLPLPVAMALPLMLALGVASEATAKKPITADESVLGEIPITGTTAQHVTKLAILPSLEPDLEDVMVRSVVRRDLELTGMFEVIDDKRAPEGLYYFDDPVDVPAWRKLGAEVIVKVAAKAQGNDRIKIFGLCYFLNVGTEPVYKKTFVVPKSEVRVTAHRITDALLGAITGRNGGFASHLTFAAKTGYNHVAFTIDADGHNLTAVTDPQLTTIAPEWGPAGHLFVAQSVKYSPFYVLNHSANRRLTLPFKTSVYSLAFNRDKTRLALAVAEMGKSAIYVGNSDGSSLARVSKTELATHPAFSPSGKLAWVGGTEDGSQRIYVDGKAVSPAGFPAAAPTFCDTEDGVLLIYSVGVGGERHDLIMSNERGGNITRLTQNQGSNTYPACSPDGRLLAYFSVRNKESGLFIKSLKNWRSSKISSRVGESLRWDALPALPTVPAARPQPAATPAVPAPAAPTPAPASPASPAPR